MTNDQIISARIEELLPHYRQHRLALIYQQQQTLYINKSHAIEQERRNEKTKIEQSIFETRRALMNGLQQYPRIRGGFWLWIKQLLFGTAGEGDAAYFANTRSDLVELAEYRTLKSMMNSIDSYDAYVRVRNQLKQKAGLYHLVKQLMAISSTALRQFLRNILIQEEEVTPHTSQSDLIKKRDTAILEQTNKLEQELKQFKAQKMSELANEARTNNPGLNAYLHLIEDIKKTKQVYNKQIASVDYRPMTYEECIDEAEYELSESPWAAKPSKGQIKILADEIFNSKREKRIIHKKCMTGWRYDEAKIARATAYLASELPQMATDFVFDPQQLVLLDAYDIDKILINTLSAEEFESALDKIEALLQAKTKASCTSFSELSSRSSFFADYSVMPTASEEQDIIEHRQNNVPEC